MSEVAGALPVDDEVGVGGVPCGERRLMACHAGEAAREHHPEPFGERAGDEVVQLYIHQRHGRAARPVRELKGFRRVTLAPGASETVTFTLGPDELRYWHALQREWVQDAATFDVWAGGDATAALGTTFEVVAG